MHEPLSMENSMIQKTEMHQFVNPEAPRVPDQRMGVRTTLNGQGDPITCDKDCIRTCKPPHSPPLEGNVGITKHKKYFHTKYTKFANWVPEMKDIQYNIASIQTEYNMIHLYKNSSSCYPYTVKIITYVIDK